MACGMIECGPIEPGGPFVRFAEHPSRGKVLVATKALYAGQTILHEAPLLLVRGGSEPWRVERAFADSPIEVQDEVLELWSPVDGPKAATFRAQLSASDLNVSEADREELVKVFMAFNFNAAAVRPLANDGSQACSDLGIGVYKIACRAAHSCGPNSFWFSDADGWRVLRTLAPVQAGEEITLDYMLTRFVLQPVHERRAEMLARREFLCDCSRCTAYGDDTRRFPCSSTSCPGHCMVHQPTAAHSPEFTPCSSCGSRPSAPAAARMLAQEAALLQELNKIDALMAGANPPYGEILTSLVRLKVPHPHHAAAARIGHHTWRILSLAGQWDRAAAALEAAVDCQAAVIPRDHALCSNRCLGDTILKSANVGAKQLRRAHQAYRKALQVMMVTFGPSPPISASLASKLAETQARLPAPEAAALASVDACSLCGGPGNGGKPLAKCGRCLAAAYCCREHQRAQWPLHKQYCRAGG